MPVSKFFEKLFQRVPGEFFGFAVPIVALGGGSIALILYTISLPFSLTDLWISNLGIGPNGCNYLFSVIIVLMGIFIFLFAVANCLWLWGISKLTNGILALMVFMNAVAIVGGFLVAIYPMNTRLDIHVIGGYLFFFPTLFFSLFLMVAMALAHKASAIQWGLTLVLAILATIFVPVFSNSLTEFYPNQTMMDLTFDQFLVFMSDMGPILSTIRFLEWLAIFVVMIWFIQTAIHFHKHAHNSEK